MTHAACCQQASLNRLPISVGQGWMAARPAFIEVVETLQRRRSRLGQLQFQQQMCALPLQTTPNHAGPHRQKGVR